jgi:predicted dehydrogenase
MNRKITRRQILQQGVIGATGALLAPQIISRSALAEDNRPGANDRVGVAFIACGRRAHNYIDGAIPPRVQVVAACDVHLKRAEGVAQRTGCREIVQDYRRILDRKDVDAVMISTPEHWHALIAIAACQAGKHVYVEKPMTMSIVEGRRMVEAARKYNRSVQCGSQQRSIAVNRDACALVRSGGIGKVTRVIAPNLSSPWILDFPGQPVPPELDWDKWCGPSPLLPYHENLYACEGLPGWMNSRDFSVGTMGNWGGHCLDQVQCALGMDATGPTEVRVDGSPLDLPRYSQPESADRGRGICQRPSLTFHYADGPVVELTTGPLSGAIFVGDKAKIEITRGGVKSNPKDLIENVQHPDGPQHILPHIDNWIDCMTSGDRPIADVEIGHRTATIYHMGNIARLLGRNLKWDPAAEKFVNDDEANNMLDRSRRKGYELPEKV